MCIYIYVYVHMYVYASLYMYVYICGMQCNGQTNDEFRYRWNNYKDSNRKSLRGEDHNQTGFFANFQTARKQ